ncbi:MAG: hypothetical protein II936_09000 [Oscillospiraceae bacterium]|nr:hypothetical protein [Oscillospiraceae bacterium]
MAINIWNDDLGKEDGLFGYVMPSDSIEVTFTVSGLGGAAAEEAAPAEEAPAEEAAPAETEAAPAAAEETTPAATGNRSAMVVGSIMAVAAAAAVAIKKRK